MIQLQIQDRYYIDLYDLEPPKFNFSIEDIRDTSTRSVFTRTFRVPATANNNQLFKTAFDVNGVDFDIRIKRSARIFVNGILFRTGQIRLNRIYDNNEGQRIDYELYFLGETKDFGTSVGEGYLNQLDLSEYDHVLNYTNITDSWDAYPESTGLTAGFFDGDILYPLIDFGVTYDNDGEPTQTRISQNNVGDHFTQNSRPLPVNRFKPMIRVKALIDKIFEEAGYSYTSAFFNSRQFVNLYFSAFGNTDSNVTSTSSNILNVSYNQGGFVSPIPFNQIVYDYGSNYSSPFYTAPITGNYNINYNANIVIRSGSGTGSSATLRLVKNGVTILDSDTNSCGIGATCNIYLNGSLTGVALNSGDTISVQIVESNAEQVVIVDASLDIPTAPGVVSIAPLLDDDYKQIDFIKDIITKFRLVMVPDKNIENGFIIEPWQNYIGSGDVYDWTHKLDLSKDFVSEPVFYTQSARIKFEDTQGEDFLNKINQDVFNEIFGRLIVNGDNDFLEGEREIKTNFIPTPITQIERANTAIGTTFIIPQIHVHEPGTDPAYNPQHRPIKQNRHLLYYNGTKDTDSVDWYIESDPNNPYEKYPMVSFYSVFPNTSSSINLNWQKEVGYIEHNINNPLLGESVYDAYWSNYIESLYDGFARRITAYFILDDMDLLDFNFDDVIRVKNTYYYVSKISDAIIGKKSSVKVELIKLLNYQVDITPIPPARLWNTTYSNWENSVFKWDV
jgi:hypothetical protein